MITIFKNERSKSVLKSNVNKFTKLGTDNPFGETYSAYSISKPSEMSALIAQIRQPASRLEKDYEDLTVLVVARDIRKKVIR
jgi:hypothetical protein